MVFNNKRCGLLTPEYVQNPGNGLFDFAWASQVTGLPAEWNHVGGYNAPRADPKIVHYTKGVPCWSETADCEWAAAWRGEYEAMVQTCSFHELMGSSVHVIATKGQGSCTANALYNTFKEGLLNKLFDMDTDGIRATLIDSADYTFAATHDEYSGASTDVPTAAKVKESGNLTTPTILNGIFDTADFVWTAVTGDPAEAVILSGLLAVAPTAHRLL